MADLISLERFKTSQPNITDAARPDPKDAQYSAAISAASSLVRSYTGLSFELRSATPTTREFFYDGSGYLDIDAATEVTAVTMRGYYANSQSWAVDQYGWMAFPLNDTVKRWIQMPPGAYGGISPEMGFTYNLDTLYQRYYSSASTVVSVTARFGWPMIPADVQQAVVWTAQTMLEGKGENYQSEAIAGYSRSKAYNQTGIEDPIPPKARAALSAYIIPNF